MYGDAETVKLMTSLRHSDIGLDTDADLVTFIEERLVEVSALMNQDRGQTEATVTAKGWLDAWNGIANRWASALIRFVMATRDSPIVRVDDFRVQPPNDQVPGTAILADLRRFPRPGNSFGVSVVPAPTTWDVD